MQELYSDLYKLCKMQAPCMVTCLVSRCQIAKTVNLYKYV